MKQFFQLRNFFSISLIIILGITILVFIHHKPIALQSIIGDINTAYPIWIKGFTSRDFNGNNILKRLSADELKIGPRKYFVFNICPLNEAVLSNAKLETHYYFDGNSKGQELDRLHLGGSLISGKGIKKSIPTKGIITRCRLKDLFWKIYRDNNLSLIIQAKRAEINFRTKQMRLSDVCIEDRKSHRCIITRSVIWNEKQKIFKIPGHYIAMTPKGRASGRGMQLDLNFVARPLS
jgi:hypothetical protein